MVEEINEIAVIFKRVKNEFELVPKKVKKRVKEAETIN